MTAFWWRVSGMFVTIASLAALTTTAYASSNAPPIVNGVVQISTPAQLKSVDQNPSSYLADTLQLRTPSTGGLSVGPAGNSVPPFTGLFNGQGYQILGVTIDAPGLSDVGFFGYVAAIGTSPGTIENVEVNANVTGGSYVGGLVGYANGATIADCLAYGTVTGTSASVGGLVGTLYAQSVVKNSQAHATVSGEPITAGWSARSQRPP